MASAGLDGHFVSLTAFLVCLFFRNAACGVGSGCLQRSGNLCSSDPVILGSKTGGLMYK